MSLKSGNSRANTRREINREELKLYLSERGKLDYIIENIEKLEDLTLELDGLSVQRMGKAIDSRLKLLNKYLPDEKSVELKNEEGGEFKTAGSVTFTFNPVGTDD